MDSVSKEINQQIESENSSEDDDDNQRDQINPKIEKELDLSRIV